MRMRVFRFISVLTLACGIFSTSALKNATENETTKVNRSIVAENVPIGLSRCTDHTCGSVGIMPKDNCKHKASNIAQKAAQEAKAASIAQPLAANAVAQLAKIEVASKAVQSAQAAEAALLGKQQILDQLANEVDEAQIVVCEVQASLQSSRANVNGAAQAIVEAHQQLLFLNDIINEAASNVYKIDAVFRGAQKEFEEKTAVLNVAKARVDAINQKLIKAEEDYEKTKIETYKTVCAAIEANENVRNLKK